MPSILKGFTFMKLLERFEKVDYPSLGPQLGLLGFCGIWAPKPSELRTRGMNILFFFAVLFFASQYIKCILNFKVESLTLVLQYSPYHMGIIKICMFKKNYRKWDKIINYVSRLEVKQYAMDNPEITTLIKEYIAINRRITYFFWIMAVFANCSTFSEPYLNNQLVDNSTVYRKIFDGYMPFNQDKAPGYYFSMIIQSVLGMGISTQIVAFDALTFAILIFFAGQLRITKLLCSQIIAGNGSEQNIEACHLHYTKLIRSHADCNSLLSPILFVYLLVAGINLAVCIMQIVKIENDLAAITSSGMFLAACLIQLFFFYWYGNEVTEASNHVSYGTFESDWPGSSLVLQKKVALLQLMTNKRFAFRTGPFNDLSLSTFVDILRASYSYYTLLKETS